MLEKLRQDDITLHEETHTYKVKGFEHLRFESATTFIGQFFEEFNAKAIAKKLSTGINAQYRGKSVEEILKMWNTISEEGTLIHAEIEQFSHLWNKDPSEAEKFEPTRDKSAFGIEWLKENLEPYYQLFPEVRLYSTMLQIAGTVDLLIYNPKMDLWVMADWKTNKTITTTAYRGKRGTHNATRLLDDCKLTKYALQMSLYTYILEKYYGIKIHKRLLLHLREKPTAQFPLGVKEFETEYLKPNVEKMVQYRMTQKENGELFSHLV